MQTFNVCYFQPLLLLLRVKWWGVRLATIYLYIQVNFILKDNNKVKRFLTYKFEHAFENICSHFCHWYWSYSWGWCFMELHICVVHRSLGRVCEVIHILAKQEGHFFWSHVWVGLEWKQSQNPVAWVVLLALAIVQPICKSYQKRGSDF